MLPNQQETVKSDKRLKVFNYFRKIGSAINIWPGSKYIIGGCLRYETANFVDTSYFVEFDLWRYLGYL